MRKLDIHSYDCYYEIGMNNNYSYRRFDSYDGHGLINDMQESLYENFEENDYLRIEDKNN